MYPITEQRQVGGSVYEQHHFKTYHRELLELTFLPLGHLISLAQAESRRYLNGERYEACFAHELFRRAIVEHSDDAWSYIYETYSPLVHSWIQRGSAYAASGENSDTLLNNVFARFWQAVSGKDFSAFPTLASLLGYLRCCAETTVIDQARGRRETELLPDVSDRIARPGQALEDATIDVLQIRELWRVIESQLRNEAERVLAYSSFCMAMKPSAIYAEHPELYSNVNAVYIMKRVLLERLRRCPGVQALVSVDG